MVFEPGRPSRLALMLLKGLFAVTAAVVFGLAVAPGDSGQLLPWDKANHVLAFYSLGLLGAVAFPRLPAGGVVIILVGFGGAIEAVQALPFVGRDAEFGDLIADAVGAVAAILPLAIARWRDRVKSAG